MTRSAVFSPKCTTNRLAAGLFPYLLQGREGSHNPLARLKVWGPREGEGMEREGGRKWEGEE